MRYAAVYGDALGNTLRAIRDRKEFQAGNLWASSLKQGSGIMRNPWLTEWKSQPVSYVVYSYDTPIAWFDPERAEWVFPGIRYSATTGRHRSTVLRALGNTTLYAVRSHTIAAENRAHELFS